MIEPATASGAPSSLTPSAAAALGAALRDARYTSAGLRGALGPAGYAALGRGDRISTLRALRDDPALATAVDAFVFGRRVVADDLAPAVGDVTGLVDAGVLVGSCGRVRATLDIRPIPDDTPRSMDGTDPGLAVADRNDDGETAADHVLGVGRASLSLLRAMPSAFAAGSRVLDIGTGCGVAALTALRRGAGSVVATDVTERAVQMAALTFAVNDVSAEAELRRGPWYGPVAGETFDHIVTNPPFVVGPPSVTHTYRDSGLDLDGATALMVRDARTHLAVGGGATMLGSWIITGDGDWPARVASWLPDHGVDAWIVQLDAADPAHYVHTWVADGGATGQAADELAEHWLDHLAAADVAGVGFGFIFLRATDAPSDVVAEDLPPMQPGDEPLGDAAQRYLDRVAWLREHDVLTQRLRLADAAVLERLATPAADGWRPLTTRIHHTATPRFHHEIDDTGSALLAGLHSADLPAGAVVDLLADLTGETIDPDAAVALLAGLVRHGLLLPA